MSWESFHVRDVRGEYKENQGEEESITKRDPGLRVPDPFDQIGDPAHDRPGMIEEDDRTR